MARRESAPFWEADRTAATEIAPSTAAHNRSQQDTEIASTTNIAKRGTLDNFSLSPADGDDSWTIFSTAHGFNVSLTLTRRADSGARRKWIEHLLFNPSREDAGEPDSPSCLAPTARSPPTQQPADLWPSTTTTRASCRTLDISLILMRDKASP